MIKENPWEEAKDAKKHIFWFKEHYWEEVKDAINICMNKNNIIKVWILKSKETTPLRSFNHKQRIHPKQFSLNS